MADRNEVLRTKTFKEDGMEVGRRVFYTLTDNEGLQSHRTAKALSLLMEELNKKGILGDAALDELLLQSIF